MKGKKILTRSNYKLAANNLLSRALRGEGEARNPLYNHSCSNTASLLTSFVKLKTFRTQLSSECFLIQAFMVKPAPKYFNMCCRKRQSLRGQTSFRTELRVETISDRAETKPSAASEKSPNMVWKLFYNRSKSMQTPSRLFSPSLVENSSWGGEKEKPRLLLPTVWVLFC